MRPCAVLLVLAIGCHPAGVAVQVPRIEADTATLVDAPFGRTTTIAIAVRNVGTATARVSASGGEPFQIPDAQISVAAGAQGQILLLMTPGSYDSLSGTVVLETDYERIEIAVTASVDPDLDGDGFPAIGAGGDDCDDTRAAVYPGAPETCDDLDDDCDGAIDDEAIDRVSWWADADADGWGSGDALLACDAPAAHARRDGDCDESDASVNPGAKEAWYDGVDQDCSDGSDYDADGDGHDSDDWGGDDCADANATIHPGAAEVWYDGIDQDCAGDYDYDADADGFVVDNDCADDDASAFPGAAELDDGIDQDCDGFADEDFLARGDLVFTEIHRDPEAVADAEGQYLEIANVSARAVSLLGMTLETGAGALIFGDVAVAPGDVALVCGDPDPALNGGLTCDAALPGLLATDDAATLDGRALLDVVDWLGWPATPGASLELPAASQDPDLNDASAAWCTATADRGDGDLGTPGTATSSCP